MKIVIDKKTYSRALWVVEALIVVAGMFIGAGLAKGNGILLISGLLFAVFFIVGLNVWLKKVEVTEESKEVKREVKPK